MLDKVSNTSKMNLVSSEDAFRRESTTKNTASAFEMALSKTAKAAYAKGTPVSEIANTLKLSVSTVKELIAMQVEVPLTRKERQAMRDEQSHLAAEHEDDEAVEKQAQVEADAEAKETYVSAAEQAYEEMYGKSLAKKKSPLLASGQSIPKSRKGDWSEFGGPKRQMRYSNSIWDADIIAATAKQEDNGERIRRENADIAAQRKQARKDQVTSTTDALYNLLRQDDLRKSASVQSTGGDSHEPVGYNYSNKVQKNGISMFDNTDKPFDRVAEKTEGEQEREKKRAPKEKNRDWVKVASSNSTKTLFQQMVDSMIDDKE